MGKILFALHAFCQLDLIQKVIFLLDISINPIIGESDFEVETFDPPGHEAEHECGLNKIRGFLFRMYLSHGLFLIE